MRSYSRPAPARPVAARATALAAWSAALAVAGVTTLPAAAQSCQFLTPVGGNGVTPIVTKTISLGSPVPFGRPNWNTDFFVTQPYRSYKLFFTANSSESATYPIEAYLKFTDGSNLQVVNESYTPQMGTGRQWTVPTTPGKAVSQVNFKIGTSSDAAATGFTYRISVQGCF